MDYNKGKDISLPRPIIVKVIGIIDNKLSMRQPK